MLISVLLAQAAVAAVPEAAAQPGVISYPAAYFAPMQPANASDMVGRLPGFSLDTGASVRGFEGAAGNVLIDGQRPASKTDSLEEILRRTPASQVERIDVIRGGAPGIDMQGKTVLANVIRKKGGGARLLVASAVNHAPDGRNAEANRIEASGSFGERKWEIGSFLGKYIDDGAGDGPAVRLGPDGSLIRRSDLFTEGDGLNGFVTGSVESPAFGGRLRLNGRFSRDKWKYEEDNRIVQPAPALETEDDGSLTTVTELGGNFTRPLGARTTLELVALRQTNDLEETDVFQAPGERDVFSIDRQRTESIGRLVLKRTVTSRISAEAGVEGALNKQDSLTAFSINGVAVDLPAADVQVEEDRGEVFLKGAWRPTDAWTLDGALRYETSTISSEGDVVLEKTLRFWKPRLAATWSALAATQLRLRVEREVGQLNFGDFVASANLSRATGVSAGNPDLDPEQAWVAEAAIEQRFWGSGVIVLTARHFELSDAVDRGPVFAQRRDASGNVVLGPDGQPIVDVFDRPTNIGDGTKDELALELTLPLDRLGLTGAQLKGDVVRRWSKVTDPTTGQSREISGLRPIEWNGYFTWDVPQHRLSFGVNAYGGWRQTYYRFDLVDTTKLRTFVHPFLEWRPQPDLNIRFELPNVSARGLRKTTLVYPGPRSAGGQPITDDRFVDNGRFFYVRVRKTFGG
jgi:outer membrane receptor protein involved in Fe transport